MCSSVVEHLEDGAAGYLESLRTFVKAAGLDQELQQEADLSE